MLLFSDKSYTEFTLSSVSALWLWGHGDNSQSISLAWTWSNYKKRGAMRQLQHSNHWECQSLNCLHFLKHEMKQWNKVQYKIQTSCPDVMKSLKCLGEVIFFPKWLVVASHLLSQKTSFMYRNASIIEAVYVDNNISNLSQKPNWLVDYPDSLPALILCTLQDSHLWN